MGTFDAEGNYTPRKVTERDVSFADSINETIVELKEGCHRHRRANHPR
jgi:hypothetical protein